MSKFLKYFISCVLLRLLNCENKLSMIPPFYLFNFWIDSFIRRWFLFHRRFKIIKATIYLFFSISKCDNCEAFFLRFSLLILLFISISKKYEQYQAIVVLKSCWCINCSGDCTESDCWRWIDTKRNRWNQPLSKDTSQ